MIYYPNMHPILPITLDSMLKSNKNDNEHPQLFTALFSLCMDYPSPAHPLPYFELRHKQLFPLYGLLPSLSSHP